MHPEVAILKFLDAVDADLADGGVRAVEAYVARFPEHEQRIRAEYERLHTPDGNPREALADRVLGGRYRVIESLGRGGFSEVFLAEDTVLTRRVAIKALTAVRALGDEWRARLLREAEATHRIDDDGLCPIHDVGYEGATPFLVMPWIQGRSLDRLLAASAGRGEGPVHLGAATTRPQRRDALLQLVERVARTLHAAHAAGVVHRDVKPANIVVRPDGRPVLIDFGLAWLEAADGGLSRTGALGTPAYAAPEVLRGRRVEPDPRLDVWGLGAVLYEGLMLRRPFVAGPGTTLEHAVLEGPAPRVDPALGPELQAVVETALARDPQHRYPTAAGLADDLARVRRGQPVSVRAAGPLRRLHAWARSRPRLVGVSIAAGAFALTCVTLAVVGWVRHREQTVVAEAASALAAGLDQLVRDADQWERFGFALDERVAQAEEHLRTVRELRRGVGSSPAIDRALARMLLAAAGLQLRLGAVERGREHAEAALELLPASGRRDDATLADREQLALALTLIGDTHSHVGDAETALRWYRRSFRVEQELLAEQPDDPTRLSNVGFGHLRIGSMLCRTSRFDAAVREQRRAVTTLERVESLTPDDVERLRHTADALLELSHTLTIAAARGANARSHEEAWQRLERAEQRLRRVCARYPRDARAWSTRRGLLCRQLRLLDDPAERAELAARAVAIARRVVQLEPDSPDAHTGLGDALIDRARALADAADWPAASAAAEAAVAAARHGLDLGPERHFAVQANLAILVAAMSIERQQGRAAAADALARTALDLAEGHWRRRPAEPGRLEVLGGLLLAPELAQRADPERVLALLAQHRKAGGRWTPALRDLEQRAVDATGR